ncbi:MAG: DNA-directed RNA polymerase subunit B'' [Candidatus Aenigmarchaeota archaeon]|nr:DNA-directed RNA polymerase subunit B'' [Candidatus Aenigmarchaeota archaeon]
MKELISSYIKEVGLVKHQINSFNEFIEYRLQNIINEIGEIELESPETAEFRVKMGRVRMPGPCVKEADGATRLITPMEARIRDLTYSSPVFVEMIPIINGVEQESQEVEIMEFPIMVRSKLCTLNSMSPEQLIEEAEDPNDPGGYFIVNGTERVIVMVEEIFPNRPIIELKNDIITARINSEASGFVQKHLVERKDGTVTISLANIKKIPIFVLIRALGLETDEDIVNAIGTEKEIMQDVFFNLYEYECKSTAEAIETLGKRMKIPQKEYRDKRLNDILDKYLLPHLSRKTIARKEKALYLASVVRKLLKVSLEELEEDDIDHYEFKRIKLVGDFMEILIRSLLLGKYGLVARILYSYQKLVKRGKLPAMKSIVESDYMTRRIISHMATGQWIGGRTGVCQRLERTNNIRTLAHLRNVISPLSSTQEHFKARALHPTSWGRLCCEETPEGVNIGLRKYISLMAEISETASDKDRETIVKMVKEEGSIVVFMDGRVIGFIDSPEKFVERVKEKRRACQISPFISVIHDIAFNMIHINTDCGRLLRPLIIVDKGKTRLKQEHIDKIRAGEFSWKNLLDQGLVEYLDAEEENYALVALMKDDITADTTHLEITPLVVMGISANLVPFAQHNRGDRVNFGAKMSCQALGLYSENFLSRTDTKADVLIYSQTPLVSTMVGDQLKPMNGQNIVIALMSFHGYNMEDAIIINKSSIERGFGRSVFIRSYNIEEKRYFGIERDEIKIPEKSVQGYKTEEAYASLGEDGIINRETPVVSGDVLVGRVSPLRFFGQSESLMVGIENRRETSETVRYGEEGIVDNVLVTETISGDKIVKIVVRSERNPEIGDKFASRHGQKGIVGLIIPESDMPFTKDGIIPDVIVNTHAIPSRMTIGQMLEIITGKLGAILGSKMDGSAFVTMNTEEKVRKALAENGFRDDGKETLYDGVTGRALTGKILIGPCYFQKLHHMVANKIHSRARGPVTLLTKQPTAGRSKQGGLRLGEMEKDCLIAHGAALLLKERFSSDLAKIPICADCGLVAVEDRIKNKVFCPLCNKNKTDVVEMSYTFKLMLDELKCMGIFPKVRVK